MTLTVFQVFKWAFPPWHLLGCSLKTREATCCMQLLHSSPTETLNSSGKNPFTLNGSLVLVCWVCCRNASASLSKCVGVHKNPWLQTASEESAFLLWRMTSLQRLRAASVWQLRLSSHRITTLRYAVLCLGQVEGVKPYGLLWGGIKWYYISLHLLRHQYREVWDKVN